MTSPANIGSVPIDPDLARQLTNAGRKADEWRATRDRLIRDASARGGSLREIATLVGLSNPGVLRIVRKVEE